MTVANHANEVVQLAYYQDVVAVITIQDPTTCNTLSPAVIQGLKCAFTTVAQQAQTKVVILQGHNDYFCSGGTEEELRNIQQGNFTLDQLDFYRILLDCPLPTIAAMQGDASGSGLVLGCYADIIIMAEESKYSANFMHFGFTPGMGATFIFPFRFGATLGNEMLLTARDYYGKELRERGAAPIITQRKDVFKQAIEQAQLLAEKPLTSLRTLKEHLAAPISTNLPTIVSKELAMLNY